MGDKKINREHTQTIELSAVRPEELAHSDRKAFLTIIRGAEADLGRSLVIEDKITIGRDSDCDLPLHDHGTSWAHARIQSLDSERFRIQDLGSTNGTRVNGHVVGSGRELKNGDRIFISKTVLRFSLADEMELGFQQQVAQLVSTDPLTGLEAKRVFDDAMDRALETAGISKTTLAVLMMDMDGLKAVNDLHGHLFGAHCIQCVGKIIGEQVSSPGRSCRFGGDEFTAMLPGVSQETAILVAEGIRKAVDEADMRKDGISMHPTISIGVAVFPTDAENVLDLVAAADQALYRAKAKGKNQVSL